MKQILVPTMLAIVLGVLYFTLPVFRSTPPESSSVQTPPSSSSPPAAVTQAALLASDGRDRSGDDWAAAKQANTPAAYQGFLAKYPQSPHSEEARSAIEALDWKATQARAATDPAAYLDFHHKYPASTRLTSLTADLECTQNLSLSFGGNGTSGTASTESLNVSVSGHPELSGKYTLDEPGARSLVQRYIALGGTIGTLNGAHLLAAELNGKPRIVACANPAQGPATTAAPQAAKSPAASNQHGTVTSAPARSDATPRAKRFEEMTASEVAQNPGAYGFEKGAGMVTTPVPGSDLEPSRDEQWTKKTTDGKLYILTIHYDKDGKLVYAKWGGF